MAKRPFDFITDYYKEKIERDRKNNEFIFSQTDSLITWIIGFAFTGLLLLIGNLRTLELGNRPVTKPIILCLLVTIVLGITFRYISFLVMLFEKGLDDYYMGLFGKTEMSPIEMDEDAANADFEEILIRLKEDFDEEIIYPKTLLENEKIAELHKLKEHYRRLTEHARKNLDIVMEHIAEVEYTAHRIPKQKNTALFNKAMKDPKIGYHAAKWSFLRSLLFSLCLLSFLAAMFIVCFSLLLLK